MASSSNSKSAAQSLLEKEPKPKIMKSEDPWMVKKSKAGREVEENWYRALYEEDSKRLLEVLEVHSNLWILNEGRERQRSRLVTGRAGNYWSKEQGTSWMGRTALHVAARRGCVPLLDKFLRLQSGGAYSRRQLLVAKDGEYNLNAIAMAVLNGNRDIVTLLLEATIRIDSLADVYDIRKRKSADSQETEEETERDRESLIELRQITQRVINRYRREAQKDNSGLSVVLGGFEPMFEAVVIHRYDLHRDFNFLPPAEYLFHFLFTGCGAAEANRLRDTESLRNYSVDEICSFVGRINEMVLTEIAEEASKSSLPGFLEFLWARHDGQGRPPFHVAVQTEQDAFFLRGKALTLTRPQISVSEETLKSTILTRDGAGRTALQRAVALGDRNETLWKLLDLDSEKTGGEVHKPQSDDTDRPHPKRKTLLDSRSDDLGRPHPKMNRLRVDELLTGHLVEVAKRYPTNEFHAERIRVAVEAFRDCLKEREFDADNRSLWKSGVEIRWRYRVPPGSRSPVKSQQFQ